MVMAVLAQVIRDVDMVVTSLYLAGQLKVEGQAGGELKCVCYTYIHILYSQLHSHCLRHLDSGQCVDDLSSELLVIENYPDPPLLVDVIIISVRSSIKA